MRHLLYDNTRADIEEQQGLPGMLGGSHCQHQVSYCMRTILLNVSSFFSEKKCPEKEHFGSCRAILGNPTKLTFILYTELFIGYSAVDMIHHIRNELASSNVTLGGLFMFNLAYQ